MTDQLRSIVDRILRLKDEQDALAEDVREVYAEAKANGYDKTALGQVVSILRKKAKDAAGFEEKSALVELYLNEIEAPRAHTRAREDAAPASGAAISAFTSRPSAEGGAIARATGTESGSRPHSDDEEEIPSYLRRVS